MPQSGIIIIKSMIIALKDNHLKLSKGTLKSCDFSREKSMVCKYPFCSPKSLTSAGELGCRKSPSFFQV